MSVSLAVETSQFLDLFAKLKDAYESDIQTLQNEIMQLREQKVPITDPEDIILDDGPERCTSKMSPMISEARPVATEASEKSRRTVCDLDEGWAASLSAMRLQQPESFSLRHQWHELPAHAALVWEKDVDKNALEEDARKLLKQVNQADSDIQKGRTAHRASHLSVYCVSHAIMRGIPVIDPGSPPRLSWDVVSMILIAHDLILIPLMVFDPPDSAFTDIMGWICLIFWTADMVASNFTGFYKDGDLVIDRASITKNYVKTWFCIDCLAVIPDWVLTILGTSSNYGRVGRVLRAARAVRVVRLLRILKLKRLVNEVYDRIASEYMFLIAELVKLLLLILLLNHMVACFWYGIGHLAKEFGAKKTWLEDVGTSPVYEGSLGWKYTTSLHWAITQFTPASMDIFATNIGERIYSICILFFGLVALSSVIGSVTASITAIRNMTGDQQKQFWLLRQFLKQRRVSKSLSNKLTKYLEFKIAAKKNIVPPGKVNLLSQLSDQLRFQLLKEINAPILEVHPFFKVLHENMAAIMDNVCNTALKTIDYAEDDIVFHEGEEALGMYFVKAGSLRYSSLHEPLRKSTYVSEAALWTHWRHRGDLVGTGEVNEIIAIPHAPFSEVMCMNLKSWVFAKRYAMDFIQHMSETTFSLLSDVVAADCLRVPSQRSSRTRFSIV